MIYDKLLRPLVFSRWNDPEDAHEFVMHNLERLQRRPALLGIVRAVATVKSQRLERNLMGLHFPNPIGLAGGFDKNARCIRGFDALGFGFIEVGTVTWHAQEGNPRPRVFRFANDEAIINRFGFNNDGAQALAERLAANTGPRRAVLGISLGKSKVTPLPDAVNDYLQSLRALYAHGDYFAVNVSSPNTPGLRELQDKSALDDLLTALDEEGKTLEKSAGSARAITSTPTTTPRLRKPILVKIAPDLEPQALDELLEVCVRRNVDGLIATNTTLSRDGLNSETAETGGLSGRPLFPRSLAIIRHIRRQLPEMPIIGVGGILNADNAGDMLNAGADLLQVYTGLIYQGPLFASDLNKALRLHVKEDPLPEMSSSTD